MKEAVRRALLLSALAAPSALYALGLGEIRLNSALNQPFDAEIELVAAAPDDLEALQAALASGDTFQRYGLDKPAYLSDFTFRVTRSGGRDVLRVTSSRPVTEPFVTMLVEASWPRGRLLREYTVLLDPPVFATTAPAAAPVAAPRAAVAAPAPAASVRAEPAPVRQAARVAPTPPVTIEPGSTYRVRPNDTLWQIASAATPGARSDVNRTMVAIYQANPAAFGGNINVLRSGAELRIPARGEIEAISTAAASDEVARQYRMWTDGVTESAADAAATGRLRLVTPEQGAAAPSTTTETPVPGPGTDQELRDRLQRLEAELAETRRLLEVRNAELATLQGGSELAEQAAAVEEPAPEAGPVVPAATPEQAAVEPEAAEPEAVAPPPQRERKAASAAKPAPEPTLLERLREYWWAVLALLLAALGVAAWLRRRRESAPTEDLLEETLARPPQRDLRTATAMGAARARESDSLVEEHEAPLPAARREREAASRGYGATDTLSGDGAISVETGDPLAEADFHMAYGLYDQAADLVQVALNREPQRRDLMLKLLEIFFVWGNRERFVEAARSMHESRAQAEPGEWDKVLIMGRQIAPDEPLFAAAPGSGAGSLDLELHAGAAPTDFELPGGDAAPLDLDLGTPGPTVRGDESVDFLIDEPVRGADDEAGDVAPTVETPRVRRPVEEPTTEVPIEDLGLDSSDVHGLDEQTQLEADLTATHLNVEDTVQEPIVHGADENEPDLMSATSILGAELAALGEQAEADERESDAEIEVVGLELADATGELAVADVEDLEATAAPVGAAAELEEEITMSEIGTKLDLARAYVDMGDPEGARSILEEVLSEGSDAQKREADRLMASLP